MKQLKPTNLIAVEVPEDAFDIKKMDNYSMSFRHKYWDCKEGVKTDKWLWAGQFLNLLITVHGLAKAALMKLEFSPQTLMAAFAKPLLCAGRIISTKFNLKTKWK